MTESQLVRQILDAMRDHPEMRLFRNNVGMTKDARGNVLRYGLAPGSSDLIGWKSVAITQEMVGQTIAQFVAIECKSALGKTSRHQQAFINTVEKMGGMAMIIKNLSEINFNG